MIRKLRLKLVALSMAALFALLAGIIAGMNVINYNAVVSEADNTLTLLAKNGGVFPDFEGGGGKGGLPPHMSPEAPYETRYFSVLLNENGEVLQTDTGRIKAVDSEMAIAYANLVVSRGTERGFAEHYRFMRTAEGAGARITFLDCGRSLESFRSFLLVSVGMALAGYLLFFFVILFFSGRIIRPVAESYEKQKRFITDAGHEIKTPLTVIKADEDVLEMDYGENEWLRDIQKQAARLTALTNDLVSLSRMEEAKDALQRIEFPFSDVVEEAAASFQALTQTRDMPFRVHIQPTLSLTGDEKAIHQLVGILLDNALKYSPPKSAVSLTLERQGKTARLSVCNGTESLIPKESLPLLFERFYRTDPSRNSQTGGHGIGLSLAKAIVEAHGGRIQARSDKDPDGAPRLTVTASFPL